MHDTQRSLAWIINILNKLRIPYQIAGGLAAKAYGSTRDLFDIDIDIPEDKFDILKNEINEFITFGPAYFKNEEWDLLLMTLRHYEQEIDISGAYKARIFDKSTGKWQELFTDFSRSVPMELLGLSTFVIPKTDLLMYKKILSRDVDLLDIQEISK